MSGNSGQSMTAAPLTGGQKALFIGVLGAGTLLWVVSLQTSIPSGKENREKARAFLKEQFPDREVSPHDNRDAPVAVVYELIRSGKPEVARRAIEFAAEQRFGYAAPYVIEWLGSGDPDLERAAQDFLRTIAGRDYGPDTESWRAWWRDPLQKFFAIAIPALLALAGVVLLTVGLVYGLAAGELGPPLLALALFMGCFLVATRFGDPHTCTFGPNEITYYTGHSTVVGLEDARVVGGIGHWILLSAVCVFGVLALIVASALVGFRRSQAASVQAGRAGVR